MIRQTRSSGSRSRTVCRPFPARTWSIPGTLRLQRRSAACAQPFEKRLLGPYERLLIEDSDKKHCNFDCADDNGKNRCNSFETHFALPVARKPGSVRTEFRARSPPAADFPLLPLSVYADCARLSTAGMRPGNRGAASRAGVPTPPMFPQSGRAGAAKAKKQWTIGNLYGIITTIGAKPRAFAAFRIRGAQY